MANKGGFFLCYRAMFDHALFEGEEFDKRSAWLWLIGQACFDATATHRVGTHLVKVERGQLAIATRYLAKVWGWNQGRISRFIKQLENESQIESQTDSRCTLITICNYRKYQDDKGKSESRTERKSIHGRFTGDSNKKQLKQYKQTNYRSDDFILEFDDWGPKQLPPCVERGLWDDLCRLRIEKTGTFAIADQRSTLEWLMKLEGHGYHIPRLMERCIMAGMYTFTPNAGDKK